MNFPFSKVVAILSDKHQISEERKSAFRGRLAHMQRLKFPIGINTGRGKPCSYSWRELLLLGIAIEFMEIGATPDRCVADINRFEEKFLDTLRKLSGPKVISTENRDKFDSILITDLSSIRELKSPVVEFGNCQIVSLLKAQAILMSGGNAVIRSPYAMIDLRQFLATLAASVGAIYGMNSEEVQNELELWSASISPASDIRRAVA